MRIVFVSFCGVLAITGGELATFLISCMLRNVGVMCASIAAVCLNALLIRFIYWDEAKELLTFIKSNDQQK